ncbi:MAG TPA: hypothetical protein VHJ17_08330 [Thermomonospora sp.]|nr:hypothetical protein [Thermomonospora sp.]
MTAEPVRTRVGRRRFVEFPYRLYRDDPQFVPPLRGECHRLLSRRRNPFFAYGEAALFVVRRDGRVVGRIAAVHNPRHNDRHNARDGFFGQFECVNDHAVAAALVGAAGGWLRRRGLTTMLGPVNFTTNDECGVLVDGFDSPPCVWTTYNPPYYPGLLERCGFTKATDLWTWERRFEPSGNDDRFRRIAEYVSRRHRFTARSLDVRDFHAEMLRIRQVFDTAWRDNWGFVPMTDAEFSRAARLLRQIADPRLIHLVEAGGEPVAVGLALPDLNQALPAAKGRLTTAGLPIGLIRLARARRNIDRVRGVLFGVVPDYRHCGLEALLLVRAYDAVLAGGYHGGAELGWTLEDNTAINRLMVTADCRHTKTHRLYRLDL